MVRIDRSLPVQTGKTNDALALTARHAEFLAENTPTTDRPEIYMEMLGSLNTIHLILSYDSLAAYEESVKTLWRHQEWRALLADGSDLFAAGDARDIAMVTVES
jgi:NIPSNAP